MKFDADKKTKIVVHDPCRDGKTAMLAAKMKFGDDAEYFGESHSNWRVTKSLLEDENTPEYTIYFVDICPPRDMLVELEERSKNTFVIDHHVSAMKECGDLWFCMFDMERSGAGLAWDMFLKTDRPLLVNYVEDYDLWRFQYPETKAFGAYMDTQELSTDSLARVMEDLEHPENGPALLTRGQHYVDHIDAIVAQKIVTRRKVHYAVLGEHKIVAVNSPIFGSEIGHYIADRSENGAALIYYRSSNGYHFSLRSREDGLDVSEIATAHGGGGHKHAAGFVTDNLDNMVFEKIPKDALDSLFPKNTGE